MTQHIQTTARRRTTRRRTLAMALVALFALPQVTEAQTRAPRGDGDRTEQRVTQLDEALGLSDAQTSQLRALFEAQKSNRPTLSARGNTSSGDREDGRAQREAQRAEMDRQVEALLTPAQVERYRALQASRPSRGPRGGQCGDGR